MTDWGGCGDGGWRGAIAGSALCVLAVAAPALGQQAPVPGRDRDIGGSDIAGSDIVVTGRGLAVPPGTPAYGAIDLSSGQLSGDASGRVENALRDVAGVQQFRRSDGRSANPSAQGVTLRALGGNASSRALVLLDGVPIADPFFGHIPFSALVGDRLAGARITRGGGTGAFGAGAVAGTIDLASATAADLAPVAASAFYGSDDAIELNGGASPRLGGGFASLSGRFERGDGFFTTPVDQRVPATARARYRGWSVNLRTVTPIGPTSELQLRTTLFGDNRTLRFQSAESSARGEDASVRFLHRGRWQIEALGYFQARDFSNRAISGTSFRLTLDQRATPATGYGGKIEVRPPSGGDHVLRIGADARAATGRLFEDAYGAATGLVTARRTAGGRTATLGLFAEDDWTLGRLVLTGGARIDRWTISDGFFREADAAGQPSANRRFADRSGTAVTGRVGALARLTDAVSLRGAGYTGFRVPTLNELYRPFVVFPVVTQANENLGLERLRGIEGGVDIAIGSAVTLQGTAFYNRLNGAIANVTIGPNLRQRRNLDAIVARGIELTVRARHGPLSADASYAFSDSRVRATGASAALDGFVPAQSPRHSASGTIGYAASRGVQASATLRYTGAQYEDDRQTDRLRPALTLDTVAGVAIGRRWRLTGRVENLFDADVITRNSGGTLDLGTPRRLWVGISMKQGER